MVDFACRTFNLEDVVRCGLSITKTDYKILKYLLKTQGEVDSKEVSNELKVDLSTAQRSLKRLRDLNLLRRKQINLSSGGYNLLYASIPKENLKQILDKIIDGWTKKAKEELASWLN
jgi:predicted transcriptional regulator